jgi:hypothetical protein
VLLQLHMPRAVMLGSVIGGRQLLDIVGPAYAYVFDCDELEGQAEHEAAKAVLGDAHDWAEIFSMLSPAEQIDAPATRKLRTCQIIDCHPRIEHENWKHHLK